MSPGSWQKDLLFLKQSSGLFKNEITRWSSNQWAPLNTADRTTPQQELCLRDHFHGVMRVIYATIFSWYFRNSENCQREYFLTLSSCLLMPGGGFSSCCWLSYKHWGIMSFSRLKYPVAFLFAYAGVLRNSPNKADAFRKQLQHRRHRSSPLTAVLTSKSTRKQVLCPLIFKQIEVFKLYYGFALLIRTTPWQATPQSSKRIKYPKM